MKIFISWSGPLSHSIACVFRDWLPSVIQSVRPYVSSEDIDKGARWSSDIAKELEAANYGLIVVTRENLVSQWINFEAGALSKSLDRSNVSPFLHDIKRSEVTGPLLQFQSTIFERSDVFKLIKSINGRLESEHRLTEPQLEKTFEVWWPGLETQLKALEQPEHPTFEEPKTPETVQSAILEEILELVRMQQRTLNSPESLLPIGYFESLFRAIWQDDNVARAQILDQHRELYRLAMSAYDKYDKWVAEMPPDKANLELYDVQSDLLGIKDKIAEIASELRRLEVKSYAEIRNRRIIPEF